MLNLIIIESNPPVIQKKMNSAGLKQSSQIYAESLLDCDPTLNIKTIAPYENGFDLTGM